MKVVHVATNDVVGGASRAAYRIHSGLRRIGHESVMFVKRRASDDPAVVEYRPQKGLYRRACRLLRERQIYRSLSQYEDDRPVGYDIFTDDRTPYGRDWFRQLPSGDIINLHWVAGFVDYWRFFSDVPPYAPIVWRLADMNPFTGGCHFDDGCGKFETGCGGCPQLGSNYSRDLSHQIWHRKLTTFRKIGARNLHIVVLNRSMVDTVKASPLLEGFPVTVIPNGIDINEFAPRGRQAAREILGLPADGRIVLFAADHMQNRRKGLRLLIEALSDLKGVSKLFLLSMGGGARKFHQRFLTGTWAASTMIGCSQSFTVRPTCLCFRLCRKHSAETALEAMACGTPVIGFDGVGCVPDLIPCDLTGRKVPIGDVKALRSALAELLQDSTGLTEMSVQCRRIVVEKFNLELQARRYAELYLSLIEGTRIGGKGLN